MRMLSLQPLCASEALPDPSQGAGPMRVVALRWLFVWCLATAIGWRAQAAQPVKARTAPPGKPTATAPSKPAAPGASDELVFIKSEFDEGPKSGKDPFFPNSIRTASRVATTNVVAELPDLVLKGISVTRNKRLAMINGYTFEEGEEQDVKAGSRTYRIKCVEIRDKSVVINYKGLTKELALRQGW